MMKKLEYLKVALNNLNVSKKHLDYFDYILKEAGIDVSSPEDRAKQTKSLIYGDKPIPESEKKKVETTAQPQTKVDDNSKKKEDSSTKTEPAPAKKDDSSVEKKDEELPKVDNSSKKQEEEAYRPDYKVPCSVGNFNPAEVYNFENNKFLDSADCNKKICLLKDVLKATKDVSMLAYLNLIIEMKANYKPNLKDDEFSKFIRKLIEDPDMHNAYSGIIEVFKLNTNSKIKDLEVATQLENWLKDETLKMRQLLFCQKALMNLKKIPFFTNFYFMNIVAKI